MAHQSHSDGYPQWRGCPACPRRPARSFTSYIPEKKYLGASVRPPAPLSCSAYLGAGKRVPTMERGTESRTHWLGRVCPADDALWDSPAPAIFRKVLTPCPGAPARTSELGVTGTLLI
jgi:hypothetical protein